MSEDNLLDPVEARVLGVLIEKELTTPDQYPLTLNALTNGCNQKSNRHPVTLLGETEIRGALERLRMRQLAGGVQVAGSRMERFRHNAREAWSVSTAGAAVLAELLLRGVQSPGDLRARASRMAELPTQDDLNRELEPLLSHGYVARMAPLPGTRTIRYDQLLARSEGAARPSLEAPPAPKASSPAPAVAPPESRPSPAPPEAQGGVADRVTALESEVRTLRAQLEKLAATLGEKL